MTNRNLLQSPDFISLFFYGKAEVCHSKPETFELEQQILDTFATVVVDFVRKCVRSLVFQVAEVCAKC